MINVKNIARNWCPPILLRWARQIRGYLGVLFEGDYACWAEAQVHAIGYDSDEVFQQVYDAALKVKRGEAVFERDAVCFYHEEYRWPTLACLLAIAANCGGHLNVLDFGGSLGSFYFQHRKLLSMLKEICWAVVEQKHFVERGRGEIQDNVLKFYVSVDDCLTERQVDVIFLSSVLQYLECPYNMLATLAQAKAPYLLVDRTAFIEGDRDRLTVQHVPDSIYKASYPAWFFSRKKFDAVMIDIGYRLITEFVGNDDVGIGEYKGLLYEKY